MNKDENKTKKKISLDKSIIKTKVLKNSRKLKTIDKGTEIISEKLD